MNKAKAKAKAGVNMDVVYTVWAETLSLGWRREGLGCHTDRN